MAAIVYLLGARSTRRPYVDDPCFLAIAAPLRCTTSRASNKETVWSHQLKHETRRSIQCIRLLPSCSLCLSWDSVIIVRRLLGSWSAAVSFGIKSILKHEVPPDFKIWFSSVSAESAQERTASICGHAHVATRNSARFRNLVFSVFLESAQESSTRHLGSRAC